MKSFGYWGKARSGWHLLPYHSLDVAATGIALLDRVPRLRETLRLLTGLDPERLRNLAGFFCALHDLGKFSPTFQWQAPAVAEVLGVTRTAQPYDVRHDSIGWVLWQQRLKRLLPLTESEEDHADIWLRCATGHHGQPPSQRSGAMVVRLQRYMAEPDIAAATEWLGAVRALFAPELAAGDYVRLGQASWWLAGFFTLADWLGSSVAWFPYRAEAGALDAYWEGAQEQAGRAVVESGLAFTKPRRSFAEMFPAYEPTGVQHAVTTLPTDEPYFLVIEESTGGGKTEAALAVAGGSALYFGLPTMATANGLWQRIAALGGQQALVHGKRWLVPEAMSRTEAWLADSARLAMISDTGVGTVDQAMLAVLYARFSTLRLLGLAGRTLIIDEVHAYDPYMTFVLRILVELHARAGGSVVLLSATMPLRHRREYAAAWARGRDRPPPSFAQAEFPLVTSVTDTSVSELPQLTYRSWTLRVEREHDRGQLLWRIRTAVASGQCVAWIRNTVAEAIETWELLNASGIDANLFHARFTVKDRLAIERRVLSTFGKTSTLEQRAGRVLIATQVIEQSLDLDFDLLITDLAPVDLLIQRAGRLHRHVRGPRGIPTLVVHAPLWTHEPASDWVSAWSRGTAAVYPDHGRLWLSLQLLGHSVELPADARRLIEGVYGPGVVIPTGLTDVTTRAERNGESQTFVGLHNALNPNSAYEADGAVRWDEERAPTRLGEPSQEWVVCESGHPISGSIEESTVKLPAHKLVNAPEAPGIKAGPWRKTVNVTNGAARGQDGYQRRVSIRYTQDVGLRISPAGLD